MEELLKIVYRNFMDTEDAKNSERVRTINASWEKSEIGLKRLKEVLSENLYKELYDYFYDGLADVQEAAFICGFSYCAKFMTNGKVDFFSVEEGGAE